MDPERAASSLQGGSQGSPMGCPGAGCLSLAMQIEAPLAHPETFKDTGTSEKREEQQMTVHFSSLLASSFYIPP